MHNISGIESLDQHAIVRSDDIDEARAKISEKVSPHRIEMAGQANMVDVKFSGVELEGVALLHAYYGCAIKAEPEDSEYFYTHTMLRGNSEIQHGENQCDTVEGDTVVLSPSVPYTMHLHEKCDRIIIRIDRNQVHSHLSHLLCDEVDANLIFDLKVRNSTSWWNTVNFILGQIEAEPSVLESKHVLQAYSKVIISSLLELHGHNFLNSIKNRDEAMLCPQLREAFDFIEFSIQKNIAIIDVAKHCNVSLRTLQRSFVKHLGITPTSYIRNAKLEAVHIELQKVALTRNGNVKRILLDYSIIDFSRFAQYYRKKYGCTPQETILESQSLRIQLS